jgi:hypothetical protein
MTKLNCSNEKTESTPITDMFKAFIHGVDGDKYWVPLDCSRGLERRARRMGMLRAEAQLLLDIEKDKHEDTRKRECESLAQLCQAIGHLSTIAEDCEAWLQSEIQEPSAEFIKAVRDYAKKAMQP